MLHAHPEIHFLPETHFFRRYIGPKLPRIRATIQGAESFRRTLAKDTEFGRIDIRPEEVLAPFLDECQQFSLPSVYRRLLDFHAERFSCEVVGDKDPRLIDFMPELDRFVPRVRVIHVIRDPRDVLLSRRKAAWSRDRSDWSHLLAYRAQMSRAKRTGPRFLGDRYLEVGYEDLLQEPEDTLAQICRHVDLEYDRAMMSFSQEAEELVGHDEWEWKKETTGPLMRNNMRKWEGKLEPAVRVLAEKLCIEPFPELGYGPAEEGDNEDIGYQWRAALHVAELVAKMFSRAYPLRTLAG